ncbi:hypothetical protein HKD37_12G034499 [Glycine soja]
MAFRKAYGKIWDLARVEVSMGPIASLSQYYDQPLRRFTFEDFQLVPTVKEFEEIPGCPLGGRKPYLFSGFYPSTTRVAKVVKISAQELDRSEYQGSVWRKGQRPWQIKANGLSFIDILALLIFGVVLFPNMEGLVDLAAIDAFLAFHHGKESPVVAILAMYDTFDRGCEKSSARIVCCALALYVWLVGLSIRYKVTARASKKERRIGTNSWLAWRGEGRIRILSSCEGCPMRGVPSDESITPFIARGFSDHNTRVLQGVRKAWGADRELRGSSNGIIGGYHKWLRVRTQRLDWLPNLKTVRDDEVKASEESDEVQALKAELERARVVKEKFKSIAIKYDELRDVNMATAEALERETKKARKEEHDQNKESSRGKGMILKDELKACLRSKRNLSQQLSETEGNMWAIIDECKEKLNLAATHKQRLEDEYAKISAEREARERESRTSPIASQGQSSGGHLLRPQGDPQTSQLLKKHALRRPYQTRARAKIMGEVEKVQEHMKADMEAMKEQMSQQPQSDHAHVSRPMEGTHGMPHHNLADFEPCLGYATEGQATHYRYSTMKRWWAAHPQSFADLVFASERINVGPKRGKFDHPTRTIEKTGANEEGEKEGETHAVTAIPVRPTNNKPPPYPLPSYPQRPSLNQPQSLPPLAQTRNTNKKEFCSKKPVEFTLIPVSYADLLPCLLDNSMVAITLAKVHQPPFLREYDSNATCVCHGEAPGRSIEHCRALKCKSCGFGMTDPLDELISCFLIRVNPWRTIRPHLQKATCPRHQRAARPHLERTTRPRLERTTRPHHQRAARPHLQRTTCPSLERATRPRLGGLHVLTFRRLHALAIRGLHVLTFVGLHALTFRGLHVLANRGLHALTLRGLHVLAIRGLHALTLKGLHVLANRGLHALTLRGLHLLAIRGLHALTSRGLHILALRGLHALTFRGLRVLIFIPGPPPDIGGRPTVQAQPEREAITQLLCIPGQDFTRAAAKKRGSHPQRHPVDPEKSNRALGFPALGLRLQDTQWTRRSPTGSWSCQALITGLCQFYGVPVSNRAFIKKYCAPRQAQGETPHQHWDGRALPMTHGRPIGDQVQSQRGGGPDDTQRQNLSFCTLVSSRGGGPDDTRRYLTVIRTLVSSRGGGPDDTRRYLTVIRTLLSSRGGGPDDTRRYLTKAVASGGSNLARLGELGGKHLPYFAINRGGSEEEKAEALPKRFRNVFREEFREGFDRSSTFFIRSSSFFDLQRIASFPIFPTFSSNKRWWRLRAYSFRGTRIPRVSRRPPAEGPYRHNVLSKRMIPLETGKVQSKHSFPPYGLPPNYTPPNVAHTPDENVDNSAPIPIESQHPQSGHAQVSQPMRETHEAPRDHNLVDFEPHVGYAAEG